MPTKKTELKRPSQTDTTFEPHFSIKELAAKWKLSRETMQEIIKNDPDVVKVRNGPNKAMTRYSVPASVATRIHTGMLNPA